MQSLVLLDDTFFDGSAWQRGVSPFIAPKKIVWQREGAETHEGLVVVTDKKLRSDFRSQQAIAWLVESPAVRPRMYDPAATQGYARFQRVITFHERVLQAVPHAVLGLMGGCHLREEDLGVGDKTRLVSMIASTKGFTLGHLFRCRVADALAGRLDLFGRGRERALPWKVDGLRDYAFSLAIENSREPHYFSEKLIDCFLTGTVPIYWGTPTIGNWFNTDGILMAEDEEGFERVLARLSMRLYEEMLPAVRDNFLRAQRYITPEDVYFDDGLFRL